MARYIRDFQINTDPQMIFSTINQYLQSEGYEYLNYDGENVFKKGKGVATGPTFFKFSFSGNMLRMETWMKFSVLPGVYYGEIGVDGIWGAAAKGPWKNRIADLENMFLSFSSNNNSSFYANAPVQNAETQVLNNSVNIEQNNTANENFAVTGENNLCYCNICGNQMPSDASFCPVCGQQRVTAAQQSYGYTNQACADPSAVSRKEFINNYIQPSLKKNITSVAVLCYICAGITFVVSCFMNLYGIIDAVILAGLALGMHLAKSRVCAFLILVFSIIEFILSLTAGSFPIWWLVAGIMAVVTFNKIEKQYKQFKSR